MALNLDIMSDEELLALADQFGIDTTPFTMPGGGGLFGAVGQIPEINAPLPFAQVGAPNIPTNLPAPINFGVDLPRGPEIFGGAVLPSLGLGVGAPRVEISPEARAIVAGIYDPIRSRAREEILHTATEAAGRRNLAMTDTPILDPLLRQQALVESQIGGQEAGSLLGLSESLRNFLQQQAQAREGAIQQRGGLEQRMGEFATTAGFQRNQILEQALQGRFGLEAQQAAQRQAAQLGLSNLGEQARQFGGQFGLNLAGLREQATQGRFGLLNNALLNRTALLERTRQFQSEFENQLRQQARQNRLQLSGQLGQTGLGLAGARFGTPVSQTQVGPLNLGGAFTTFGLGASGLRDSGFF